MRRASRCCACPASRPSCSSRWRDRVRRYAAEPRALPRCSWCWIARRTRCRRSTPGSRSTRCSSARACCATRSRPARAPRWRSPAAAWAALILYSTLATRQHWAVDLPRRRGARGRRARAGVWRGARADPAAAAACRLQGRLSSRRGAGRSSSRERADADAAWPAPTGTGRASSRSSAPRRRAARRARSAPGRRREEEPDVEAVGPAPAIEQTRKHGAHRQQVEELEQTEVEARAVGKRDRQPVLRRDTRVIVLERAAERARPRA